MHFSQKTTDMLKGKTTGFFHGPFLPLEKLLKLFEIGLVSPDSGVGIPFFHPKIGKKSPDQFAGLTTLGVGRGHNYSWGLPWPFSSTPWRWMKLRHNV